MTLAVAVSSVLSALVLAIALVLPAINSPTVPFGVRVPARRADDPAVARQTRLYRWRVLVGGAVTAATGITALAMTGEPALLPLPVLLSVGVWYGSFLRAHHEIRAAKVAGRWFGSPRGGTAVDPGPPAEAPRFPWLWLAPVLCLVIVTVVVGVLLYPSMPGVLAVHNGVGGAPDRTVVRSVGTAFSPVFAQVVVSAVLVGMATAIVRGASDVDPARPAASVRWLHRYREVGARALLGLVALIDLGLLGSALLMWTGTVTPWAPLVVVVPVLTGVVVAVVVLAGVNREPDDGAPDVDRPDDDRYWRGGLFYVNREDHALLVPRRFGIGWTVNLGNPLAVVLLAGVLAVIGLMVALRAGG